jgi:hypothetical protein
MSQHITLSSDEGTRLQPYSFAKRTGRQVGLLPSMERRVRPVKSDQGNDQELAGIQLHGIAVRRASCLLVCLVLLAGCAGTDSYSGSGGVGVCDRSGDQEQQKACLP